ncbi:uncharacterized protein Dwil_GK26779 [Drosophila willistoni]|uniref:uncharacterized protein LOC26528781 n=1 Tax=Drosophila willistoni TaxID=7260 RepID=UPI0007327BBF|nr:uncharacterized protein LOC26528781 [Drosophila willistoni]KRF98034.1 uncharacterized protein Dwil_GK26779 [Drosophila willistoni]
MRACLLYFCIFTLLQSRYVLSEDIWLPNLRKLASIIYSCERDLNLENVGSLQTLDNESISNKRVDLKSSARSQGDGSAQASANVVIRNGDRALTISNSVDLGPGKGRLPRRAGNDRNDQSSVDSSVSVNLGGGLSRNKPLSNLRKQRELPIILLQDDLIKPRSAPKKKSNPISISIGDSNANNQIIQDDIKPTAAPNLLDIFNVQPRSPWGIGLNISGGKGKPKTASSTQALRKRMYGRIANCVKKKLIEEYQEKSAFSD